MTMLSTMFTQAAFLILAIWLSPILIVFYFLPRFVKRQILMTFFECVNKPERPRSYEEHVLPHGPLVQRYDNLWTLTGTLPDRGPKLPRMMVIYRMPGTSSLVIHSPICVREGVAKQIENLGEISYIIVPNPVHRLDIGPWAKRYPKAKILTPSFAMEYVENRVPRCLPCEKQITDLESDSKTDRMPGVRYMRIGHEEYELAYLMRLEGAPKKNSSAVVVCDTFFNLDKDKAHWITRLLGSADGFGMTKMGVIMANDLKTTLDWFCKLRDSAQTIPIESIFLAHGEPVIGTEKVILKLNEAIYRLGKAI